MADQAIAVAQQVGSTDNYVRGLSARANALLQLGDPSGEEDIRETLRISLDRNNTQSALVAYNNLATNVIVLGRLVEGRGIIEEAIEYAGQRGYGAAANWSRMTRCEALFPLGEWGETLAEAERLVVADEARGGSQVGTFAKAWQATVLFFKGPAKQAKQLWVDVLEQARKAQDAQGLFPALAIGTMIWEAAGEAAEARRMAEEFAQIAVENPVFLAQHLPTLAEAMVSLGMESQVEQLVRIAKPTSDWMIAQIGGATALVSEERGDFQEALSLYQAVIDLGLPLEQRFWVTKARIGAGRCLLALDQDASTELNFARADAEAMEASRLLDEIDTLENPEEAAVEGN